MCSFYVIQISDNVNYRSNGMRNLHNSLIKYLRICPVGVVAGVFTGLVGGDDDGREFVIVVVVVVKLAVVVFLKK